jgi:hypothetical protein
MEKYNLEKLVRVKVNNFWKSKWFVFKEGKQSFFNKQKRGFYQDCIGLTYISEDCPKNHTLKNGVVYENPEVILSYEGGISKTYYFDKLEDAKDFANKFVVDGKWIS